MTATLKITVRALVTAGLISAVSCTVDDTADVANDPPIEGTVILSGSFSGTGGHKVSGRVRVIETDSGELKIRLEEDFTTQDGPDLDLFVSQQQQITADGSLQVSELKALSGSQNFDLPAAFNRDDYTHAVIYCVQFSVPFGVAELTVP